jgi:RND family efflux transporter MFP subunit
MNAIVPSRSHRCRVAILTATCLISAAFSVGCARTHAESTDEGGPGPVVGVAPVVRKDLSRSLSLAAEFRPYQEVDIHAKVAGYVKSIRVDVGDRVKQGELLAVLEVPELQDDIQQADAAVKRSQDEVTRAKDELQRAQSAEETMHLEYTRLQQVAKTRPNLVAEQELDDSQSRDRVGAAQVSAAQAAIAAAEEELAVAKANRDREQTLYSYTRIVAPFTGVVTKRYADTGSMIQAGTASQTQAMPVVTLSQNDLLRLIIPVPESVVPDIHIGTPVSVTVPSLKRTLVGKVTRFADSVDFDTRTMPTEIDVKNPNLSLVPGMYAEASTVLESRKNVLTVPVQALDRHDNKVSVMVVGPDHELEVRDVQIGLETPSEAEVISGLKENDQVVMSSRGQLRAGETVQPKVVAVASAKGDS